MTDAGQIKYTVAADTGDLLKAADITDKAIDSMVTDLQRVDRAADSMASSVNQSASQVQTQMTRTAQAVESGIGGMGQAAQNFSYQIQDIAVQLAGGQSPFLVMAQQIPQMLVGFGAAAAAVGALVAVFGGLYMVMSQNEQTYDKTIESVKALTTEYEKLSVATARAALIEADKQMPALVNESQVINRLIKDKQGQIAANERLMANYEVGSKTYNNMQKAAVDLGIEIDLLTARQEENDKSIAELGEKRAAYLAIVNNDTVAMEKLTKTYKDNSIKLGELKTALELQVETLGMSNRELSIYTANMLGATQADRDKINAAYDLIEAEQRKQDALNAQSQIQGFGALGDPVAAIELERQRRLEIVAQYEELETANHEMAAEARKGIDRDYYDSLSRLQQKSVEETSNAFAGIEGSAGRALTSFITGAQSGEDAIRSLANSILTQMIGALVQMGIASLVQQTTAATAAAATGSAIATAYAPAAAAVSLASYGANAAPAAAGIAATYGMTQALSFGGGRQFGGGVGAGSYYRVGEAGPEIYQTSSGRNYMIPGENGKVIPNDSIGSTVNVDVRVQNYGGQSVDVRRSQSGDGTNRTEVINIIVGDILSGGKTRNAITRATTAKNRVT